MDAICISCGTPKNHPAEPCSRCGLDPNDDDDQLVKSMYLSTDRYSTAGPKMGAQYAGELEAIAARLQGGQPIEYDEKELDRLRDELEMMKAVPAAAIWGALLRQFLPLIVFVVVVCLLIAYFGSLQ